MATLRSLFARFAALFRREELDQRANDELRFHIEMQTEENLRAGLSPNEARRQARIQLGGLEQSRQLHREGRGMPAIESLLLDVRYGVRMLRRDAQLTIFAVLITGFGLGASATVFSVVHALLLRPLPFEEPERLVWIANGDSLNLSSQTVQVNSLLDLREENGSFSGIAAFSPFYGSGDVLLSGVGEPQRLTGVPVTETFFSLLGLRPEIGRFFTADECAEGGPRTVVLDYGFWERRFASDPGIVGQSILLDGEPATVVGVAPESFDFADIFAPGSRVDLFRPFPLSPEANRSGNTLALIGRLNPDIELSAAQAEATVLGNRVSELGAAMRRVEGRDRNAFDPRLSPLRERVSGRLQNDLLALVGAVGFLMLLICVNLSNLLLARATVRHKEMAVRAALGADRKRLVRQLLIESGMLSACGAALGLGLAVGGTHLLAQMQGASLPLLQQVRIDGDALGFTVLAAVLTAIAFGTAPALQASSVTPQHALKEGARGSTGGAGRSRLRATLVVGQIALACVLLTGASLLLRSLGRVLQVDLGFDSENLLAVRVDPGRDRSTQARRTAYFDEVLRQTRTVPGVEAVALTDALPFGDNSGWRMWDAATPGSEEQFSPLVRIVDEGYFSTMKIAVVAGRAFSRADDASNERVVIVNEALAARLWPDEDPLGRMLSSSGDEYRVVGLVDEARYFGLERESGPEMYLSIRQTAPFLYSSVDLVTRTSQAPGALVPAVREALRSVDPSLPATDFRTMRGLIDNSLFVRRFVVLLTSGFALFGLILAALGIYALISYSVGQRRNEIGVCMALGASPANIQERVLFETMRLAAFGVVFGLIGSWMAARGLRGLLFGVSADDPVAFVAGLATLSGCAALAGYLPARRVSQLNPADALRGD